ncbi:MAG: acylglycerol kinase family protein, partial [Anaerolineae bacterium]|nr:acylglycerol kinase family protein [Anaerolineae bacterium]
MQHRFQFCPSPKHVVALVNTNSGMGGGRKTLKILRSVNWPAKLTIFETRAGSLQPQMDAVAYARDCGADRILVSGGDGTVMEVLTAMLDTGDPIPISLVPAGTGNIVASDLELPRRIFAAVRQGFSSGRLRW